MKCPDLNVLKQKGKKPNKAFVCSNDVHQIYWPSDFMISVLVYHFASSGMGPWGVGGVPEVPMADFEEDSLCAEASGQVLCQPEEEGLVAT